MRLAVLLLSACLAPVAFARQDPAPQADPDVQAARAMTCAAFLSEASNHAAAGGHPGKTPSFALVFGYLLKRDEAIFKASLGARMFAATKQSCERARGRTLGSVMDAEFERL